MKLGVSYNVFDGEELLEGSIRCIREEVDYISVVYQTTSNYNHPCSPNLEAHLIYLKSIGLIDEILKYTPKIFSRDRHNASYNECEKRNIGLELSRNNVCTHHMSMDCDEFYILEQFKYMKEVIVEHDYELTICHFQNYYKDFIWLIKDSNIGSYVTTIFKIFDNTEFIYKLKNLPVPVDPTRRIDNKNFFIFDQSKLKMHHATIIRKNIRSKLLNSSYRKHGLRNMEKIISYYDSWEYPEPALLLTGKLADVIKVERLFKIAE